MSNNIFITVGINNNFKNCRDGVYTARMIDVCVSQSYDATEVKGIPCTGPSFPVTFKRSDCLTNKPACFEVNGKVLDRIRPNDLDLKAGDRLAIIPKKSNKKAQ